MACFFGHKWNGCKCSKCGIGRDSGHIWENGKCTVCSANLFDNTDIRAISGICALAAGMTCFKEDTLLRISSGIANNMLTGCNFTEEETEFLLVSVKIIVDLFQGGTISNMLSKVNTNHPSPDEVIIASEKTLPKLFAYSKSIGYEPALNDTDTFKKYVDTSDNNDARNKAICNHTLDGSKCSKCGKTIEEIIRDGTASSQWSMSGNSQSKYYSKKANSLAEACEILKQLSSIPAMTYYLVDTPDGTLGRDTVGFFTESPLKTKGLQTNYRSYGKSGESVESQSLMNFDGDVVKTQSTVAALKAAGQYASLILMMKCGQCGYESPIETQEGGMDRECYFCGTNNKTHRMGVNVFTAQGMVKL